MSSAKVAAYVADLIASSGYIHTQHLNTKSYPLHKALDEYYKNLPEKVDVLAEALIGFDSQVFIPAPTLKDTNCCVMMDQLLKEGHSIHKKIPFPAITNPLEDILTFIAQIKYKINLK